MKLNCKWKIFFLVLLIATISIQGYSLYADATVKEVRSSTYFSYIAFPLDYEPENYWNLTDPDQYILEAIENPGNWTEPFNYMDSTFWYAPGWLDTDATDWPLPFKYNGTYYNYGNAYPGRRLVVTLLDKEPEEYWNLTDPDKYTLEGIENPGKTIVVGIGVKLTLQLGPFQYNGKYYDASVAEHDYGYPSHSPESLPPKPEHIAIVLAGTWVAVGSVFILQNRKTKTERTKVGRKGMNRD